MDPLRVEDYFVLPNIDYGELDDDIPSMQVELPEYPVLWRPWRRTLLVKILGRNINFSSLGATS